VYSFLDWLEAVRYRWRIVAVVVAAALAAAFVFLLVAAKSYTATATLLIDQQQQEPVDPKSGASQTVIPTQADLIQSPSVAHDAAVRAGLDKDSDYIAEWREQTKERVPYDQWLQRQLLANVQVDPGKDSDVLQISTTGRGPIEAARLANGFAEATVARYYRLRTEPAKAYAKWLEGRLAQARDEMVKSQATLAAFMRETGLAQGDDLSSEGQRAASIASDLATAEAHAASANQSNFSQEQGLAEAEKISTVQSLRQDVDTKTAELAKLQETFGPNYPDVKTAKAALASSQANLQAELSNAWSTFTKARDAQTAADRAAANAAEQRLRALTQQQQSRLQAMGQDAAQYTTLKNDYMAAQRNYNDLDQKLATMQLQSAVPQTEMQVLDTASPFLVSTSPAGMKVMAFATLIGLILGSLLAILLEFLDRRVRTWGAVERLIGVQVIGKVALPPPPPAALPKYRPLLLQSGAK
jgi:uncharacterized protein involved in exopolysaccharide biosynthesis